MKSFLKVIKFNFSDNFSLCKKANKNSTSTLIKLSKANHTSFLKSNYFNMSQKTKSKKNNYNNNSKNTRDNNKQTNNYSNKKTNLENNMSNKENNNSPEEIKKEVNKKPIVNRTKETNTQKFLNFFKENFPLELKKKKNISIDSNLTCFVPYDQIINRIKAVSIGKTYLENLVDKDADFSDICEDNFFNLIRSKIDNLKDFRIEDDDIIKYNLSFNKSFKKIKFLVNLHNIKNFMCIGYDPSKDVAKNLKNFQHLEDHIIENPFNQFKDLRKTNKLKSPNQARSRTTINLDSSNNPTENNLIPAQSSLEEDETEPQNIIETIKCDLIINRSFNGIGGFSVSSSATDLQRKYEEFKISLISHFYFSIIIEKTKESDDPLKLVLEITDELDDVKTKKEFEIEQIDFICQAEILKINYKEYQESIKLMELIEKNERMDKSKKSAEVSIDAETGDKINCLVNINDCDSEDKIEMLDYNQITDVLKNLSFLKSLAKTEKLKIVNVDGINKNFSLI